MPKVISSTELHRRTRAMLDRVRDEGEAVIIEKHQRPVAVLLPYEALAAYLAFRGLYESRSDSPFPPPTLDEVAGSLPSGEKVVMVEEMEGGLRRGD